MAGKFAMVGRLENVDHVLNKGRTYLNISTQLANELTIVICRGKSHDLKKNLVKYIRLTELWTSGRYLKSALSRKEELLVMV
jgi:hypothetical protein